MARRVRRSSAVLVLGAVCGAVIFSQAAFAAPSGDRDGDGMPNRWERDHGLDPTRRNASGDRDGDGLVNIAEFRNGSDPRMVDSDRDGLTDRYEVKRFSSSPKTRDTDRDGIRDGWEDGNENGILDEGEDHDRDGFVGVIAYYDPSDDETVIELAAGWPILAFMPPGATLVMEKACDTAPLEALSLDDGVDVLELYLEPQLKKGMVVIQKMVLGCPEAWMS